MATFSRWLANMLKEREIEVQRLLKDEAALQFLIAWSLFESKCFSGFLKARKIREISDGISKNTFPSEAIVRPLTHFHARYQDEGKLKNLLHDDKTPPAVVSEFRRCLKLSLPQMQLQDRVFTLVFVIYRYRNNMFHGNKGVGSWLQFGEQIRLCTYAMQEFVAHAESLSPTMCIEAAA